MLTTQDIQNEIEKLKSSFVNVPQLIPRTQMSSTRGVINTTPLNLEAYLKALGTNSEIQNKISQLTNQLSNTPEPSKIQENPDTIPKIETPILTENQKSLLPILLIGGIAAVILLK